jgi:hypothetical protein
LRLLALPRPAVGVFGKGSFIERITAVLAGCS